MIVSKTWQPRQRANLLFILRRDEILLIRKKRGFGAGKINGPGGKIDPGETPLESALRETYEELGIRPLGAEQRGELRFQFRDGWSLHCAIFLAHDFEGEPHETDEAIPIWTPLDAIPYDEMWADDRYWLPLLIRGESFVGSFEFDGEELLTRELIVKRSDPSFSFAASQASATRAGPPDGFLDSFREYCLTKPGASEEMPFGPDALVFKVSDKMFALASLDDVPPRVNLKCDPGLALELRDRYEEVSPGYHMNKKHWNTIELSGGVPAAALRQMIDHSYKRVLASLTKKERAVISDRVKSAGVE